jgi:5,10-methylenetetrahydromethanopterin reductase
VVASAFATLHEACPRRLILGAGLGDSAVETMGKKPARLAALEAGLRRIRELLAGRDVATETGTIRLKHAIGDEVPIYVAASGPKMLALAGRIADGAIVLVGVDDARVRQALAVVAAGARAAGRDPGALDLVLWVPCAVADDGAAARDAVKAHVARALNRPLPFALDERERRVVEDIRQTYDYYGHMEAGSGQARVVPDWLVDRFAIAGTAAECRAAVERLRASGIRQLAIIPYGAGPGGRAATLRAFVAAAMG